MRDPFKPKLNIGNLLLVVIVIGMTILNTYTTKVNTDTLLNGVDYNMNEMARSKIVSDMQEAVALKDEVIARLGLVADFESQRASCLEAELISLKGEYVTLYEGATAEVAKLQQLLEFVSRYAEMCNQLLEENDIDPPQIPRPRRAESTGPQPTPAAPAELKTA